MSVPSNASECDEGSIHLKARPVLGFHPLLFQDPRPRAVGSGHAALLPSFSAFRPPNDLNAGSARTDFTDPRSGQIHPLAHPQRASTRFGIAGMARALRAAVCEDPTGGRKGARRADALPPGSGVGQLPSPLRLVSLPRKRESRAIAGPLPQGEAGATTKGTALKRDPHKVGECSHSREGGNPRQLWKREMSGFAPRLSRSRARWLAWCGRGKSTLVTAPRLASLQRASLTRGLSCSRRTPCAPRPHGLWTVTICGRRHSSAALMRSRCDAGRASVFACN